MTQELFATENMVRNGQDLFGAIYMVNKVFEEDNNWATIDTTLQQKILYNLWVNASDKAKTVWIMTAHKYLQSHNASEGSENTFSAEEDD